jgi:hypothetical protein
MRARPYGGLFVVCLDSLSGSVKEKLAAILARAKFVQAIPMTGMAGDILPMEAPGHPALRFARISDDSTIQTFAELNCIQCVNTLSIPAQQDTSKADANVVDSYGPLTNRSGLLNRYTNSVFARELEVSRTKRHA